MTTTIREQWGLDRQAQRRGKHEQRPAERFSMPVHIVEVDAAAGIVKAVVAVSGVVIDTREGPAVIQRGAFAKTLSESWPRRRVLDNHNNWSVLDVVAIPLETREIGREDLPPAILAQYPQATGGLYTEAQYLLDTPEGFGVFQRIQAGAVDEYSIGFDPMIQEWGDYTRMGGEKQRVRYIKEIRLWEFSPVIWGANPATGTVETQGAVGPDEQLALDLIQHVNEVIDAFYRHFENDFDWWEVGISKVYPDHLIVHVEARDKLGLPHPYYQVAYTLADSGAVNVAPIADWVGGEFVFVPVNTSPTTPAQPLPENDAAGEALVGVPQDAETPDAGPDGDPPTFATEAVRAALMRRASLLRSQLFNMGGHDHADPHR